MISKDDMILDAPRKPSPPRPSLLPLIVLILLLLGDIAANFPTFPSAQEQRNQHLSDAVRARETAVAARLIEEGADPETRSFGASLPAIAAAQDDVATLSLLQTHGADLNVQSRGVEWNPRLFRGGTEADDSFWILASYRTTPLMEAVLHDNLDAARFLLDHGASLDTASEVGATMLMMAVHASRPAVVQLLLQRGAAVNAAAPDGETALMTAAARGRADLMRPLLAAGAEVNVQDRAGNTPLSEAIFSNNISVVQILLMHGVVIAPGTTLQALLPREYVNAPGVGEMAILKDLAAEVRPEIVRLLVAHGVV